MTHIEVHGLDDAEYVVHAVPWIIKNDLRIDCTEMNFMTGEGRFDRKKFIRGMMKVAITKNSKPLTDSDLDQIDGKTGDALDIAVFKLNDLTKAEKANLLEPPAPKAI